MDNQAPKKEHLIKSVHLEALRCATSKLAAFWGLGDCGVLKLGCRADLVLLVGNPAKGIKSLRKIDKAWIDGVEAKN
jgi:imidazolonepropionase-like amidohydrolase